MNSMKLATSFFMVFALNASTDFANAASSDDEPEAADTERVEFAEVPGGKSAAEVAQKLANPLAAMISVPMQLNYDQDFAADDAGDRYLLNIQPVVPISLSDDWNLISRTILPVISQDEVVTGTGRQSGLGDTSQSLWFSPVKPTDKGLIWGVGPVILFPTATDDLLGGGKWGLGPTVVGLKQIGHWTVGGLANHIWSVAGSDKRNDINNTFIQPFLSYNTLTAWTYSLNLESSYDWESEQWSIPANFMVSKLKRFGKQMISFQGGVRYWLKSTDNGPEGVGLRFAVILLFPK